MKISNLLGTANKILGPINFVVCAYGIFYCCFYVNYLLWGEVNFGRQLLFGFFLFRNSVIYLICICVNVKVSAAVRIFSVVHFKFSG